MRPFMGNQVCAQWKSRHHHVRSFNIKGRLWRNARREKLKELTIKQKPSKMLSWNKTKKPSMDRTVKAQQRKVKKLFTKQNQTGKTQTQEAILRDQISGPKTRPSSLLEICWGHHRTGGQWPRTTTKQTEKDSSVSLNPWNETAQALHQSPETKESYIVTLQTRRVY